MSNYQYGNVSPLYVDAGCPTQCFANNEYSDLGNYYNATPIPSSTAVRIFNTPLNINPNTYAIQGAQQSIASGVGVAASNQAAATAQKEGFRFLAQQMEQQAVQLLKQANELKMKGA